MLGDLPVHHDDRVLIDYRTSDDAGVYRLDEHRALVQTVDFFTPIVDDPFVYGQIAAANALSDVYAMGGRPLTALAIAAFPLDLDRGVLQQIFAGGLDKLREAGVALLGGHTVQDPEVKFGYAVTGEVDPALVLANGGAIPGDVLLLTKPIGTGIIATALKFDRAPQAAIAAAVRAMTTLNRAAAEAIVPYGASVHACTDITGFGVIGHAAEMAAASRCSLEINAARVPIIEGARQLVQGNIPGGGRTNREHFGPGVAAVAGLPPELLDLLYDPQTSGGLLLAIDPAAADRVRGALVAAGVPAVAIGRALPAVDAAILIT
ncbi:MAG: selenide, water dikinase [Acidobacteriota bacterium]